MPCGVPRPPLSPRVRALLASSPVFDAHVDAIGRALDLGDDLARSGRGQFDLVRAAEGGLGAWVVVCWVDPASCESVPPEPSRSFARARDMLAAAHELGARHPERFRLVGNGPELAAARAAGRIAGVAGIEGGHALEGSLEKLGWFFEHGLRVLTLVWNNHLSWMRSCQPGAGADVPEGLSDFGRELVRELDRLGIVIDLSHAGKRSFLDVLETSERPVIASHSGCRALHDHPRNLDDEKLCALAAREGVVGIVFHPGFLDAEARAEEARVRATPAYTGIAETDPARRFLRQQRVMREHAAPLAAARLVEHVVHAVEVAGIDHVGLGSDYDGIERGPEWLEDASGYAVLAELLARRGFTDADLQKVLGLNMERVFRAVTAPPSAAATAAIRPLGHPATGSPERSASAGARD